MPVDPEQKLGGRVGPLKGEFVAPPPSDDADEKADALPAQEEFWRPPTRFGSVPVEKEPLGWDKKRGFRKLFPQVMLPTQVVERVSFGHPELEPNRLFWGDNLHVMRQLPSESIDLIYIDPPFFSGRQYNVIFGDQNELRSFSDIWEGGMPGYLVWLNARLYEMKRLLKKTGSIYVHCDWHASHYIKVELDKVFGNANFRNEVIWAYPGREMHISSKFNSKHDVILFYSKTSAGVVRMSQVAIPHEREARIKSLRRKIHKDEAGREWVWETRGQAKGQQAYKRYLDEILEDGQALNDVWSDIQFLRGNHPERVGYPTQKPEDLLSRIILAATKEGESVADFFTGGGTTAVVAQRLGRRWIACDQSRVAVAITADRLAKGADQLTLSVARASSPVNGSKHGQDAHATASMADADQGQDANATAGVADADHGQAAHATPGGKLDAIHGRDDHATLNIRQGAYLPHWTHEGSTYAVTFRLGDSLPQHVLQEWLAEREAIVQDAQRQERELTALEVKRLRELHSDKVERYLDVGHGECWMRDSRIATIIADALRHFDGERYDLVAWCVMPNHVHAVVRPREGHELPAILHSWKSFSAKEANKVLSQKGQFWQEEYYDHLVRDEPDFNHCVEYVLANPEKAGLQDWKWVGSGGGTGVPPVEEVLHHGHDAHATTVTSDHGRDAHATGFEAIPDFTIEHWGVYEAKRLSETPPEQFREFVLRAFGATPESGLGSGTGVPPVKNHGQDAHATHHGQVARATIHGHKGAVPVWVGEPSMKSQVTAAQVQEFANAVRKTVRYQQDNLREGTMLAWAFRPDAIEAAQRLREMEHTDLNFIRLDMVRIDSPRFREHITALTTDHADYANFLTFIQPPQVHVGWRRVARRTYVFDVGDTVLMNSGAKVINVQWDFNFNGKFRTTQGYAFLRTSKKEPELQAQYEFPGAGRNRVACRVQDDMGGEGFWVGDVEVE